MAISNDKNLAKRARAKYATNGLVEQLIYLESPLTASYVRTMDCATVLHLDGQKLTGRYCGNRWCLVCNRIRTGKLINGYQAALAQLPDKYMVTLTIPNCLGVALPGRIETMHRELKKTMELARKTRRLVSGIRKLECTHNADRNDFHPHFHLIVSGRDNCEFILKNWLARFPESRKVGQDITKADEHVVGELFKYFTKLISRSKTRTISPAALDVIFQAMRKRRVFQPFGEVRKLVKNNDSEEIDELQAVPIDIDALYETWFVWTGCDWYNTDGGEALTDYKPTKAIQEYIERLQKTEA